MSVTTPALWDEAFAQGANRCPIYERNPRCAFVTAAPSILPTPEFDFVGAEAVAGIRPHRNGSYKLESESREGRMVIHNYGHSGAGITMSWGCAELVLGHVRKAMGNPQLAQHGIAIIGGGVMALTAATLIKQEFRNVKISLYTKDYYPDTTSRIAGGQWCPADVECEGNQAEYEEILKSSHAKFASLVGKGYGVSNKMNYTLNRSKRFDHVVRLNLVSCTRLDRLPFAGPLGQRGGYAYRTFLVEPQIFLAKLHDDLKGNIGFNKKTFESWADIKRTIPAKIIVNCTGFGAKALWGDPNMEARKGHLVLLPAQPKLDYLLTAPSCAPNDFVQYMFPRQDKVIVGGTFTSDESVSNAYPNAYIGGILLANLQSLFNSGELLDRFCKDGPNGEQRLECYSDANLKRCRIVVPQESFRFCPVTPQPASGCVLPSAPIAQTR